MNASLRLGAAGMVLLLLALAFPAHAADLILQGTPAIHLGDSSVPEDSACSTEDPFGVCWSTSVDLTAQDLAAFETLAIEYGKVHASCDVTVNGTLVGVLPIDGLGHCEFTDWSVDVAGELVVGTNTFELCVGDISSQKDDMLFRNLRLVGNAVGDALVLNSSGVHIGDNDQPTIAACANVTPLSENWSTSFDLSAAEAAEYTRLSVEHFEVEWGAQVYLNGGFVADLSLSQMPICEWARDDFDVTGLLLTGSNTLELRSVLTGSGNEWDDWSFRHVELSREMLPPISVYPDAVHLGDTTNSSWNPCATAAPYDVCLETTITLGAVEAVHYGVLSMEHGEVEYFASVELNGQPLGILEPDDQDGCQWIRTGFDVSGKLVAGDNTVRVCAEVKADGSEYDDFGLRDLVLEDFAGIVAKDVPADQGGWLRFLWGAPYQDSGDEAVITQYGIWRRLDAPPTAKRGVIESLEQIEAGVGIVPPELAVAVDWPAGWWEGMGSVPAVQKGAYSTVLPSLGDTPVGGPRVWTDVLVSTHTTIPSAFHLAGVTSGHSTDDIAPEMPKSLMVTTAGADVKLQWAHVDPEDFAHYAVFKAPRGSDRSGFESLGTTVANQWTDGGGAGSGLMYVVLTVDDAGNESPLNELPVAAPGVPTRSVVLEQNVPNPFNPTTVIAYELTRRESRVSLRVYDAAGRLVQVLVDGPVDAGRHVVIWDGRDSGGRGVASGTYYYRLETPDRSVTRKMTLIK